MAMNNNGKERLLHLKGWSQSSVNDGKKEKKKKKDTNSSALCCLAETLIIIPDWDSRRQ